MPNSRRAQQLSSHGERQATGTNTTIASNDATYVGGLGVGGGGSLFLTNTVFHSNSDGSSSGGSSYYGAAVTAHDGSSLSISFSTIVASNGTYALTLHQNSFLEMNNSIMAFNNGYGLYLSSATSGYVTGGYNAFWENAYDNYFYSADVQQTLEANVVQADPAFTSYDGDPDADDLHLDGGSPCVDAGDPDQDDTDGSRADMGAYGGAGGDW